MSKNSTLLDLPIELLHWFFDYLDTKTILNSIRPVCFQLHQVVKTYDKFRLDLSSCSDSDLRFIANFIEPFNVITLKLINNDATGLLRTNLFFRLFQIDQFTRLKSLTLIGITDNNLDKFFQHMIVHRLLSLSITLRHRRTIRENQRIINLLSSTIPHSNLLNLSLNITNVELIINELYRPIQNILQYLTINRCTYHEYHIILYYCPVLRTLIINNCNWENLNTMQVPSVARKDYQQLTSLTLNKCLLTTEGLHSLLLLTPKLVHLKVIYENVNNLSLLNGYRWEKFIQTELSSLKKFQFSFTYNFRTDLSKPSLESIIVPFRRPFWLNNKHWIVNCDYILTSFNILLYTIPMYINDSRIIIRCNSLSENNYYHILTRTSSGHPQYIYTEQALTTLNLSKIWLTDGGTLYLTNALTTNKILTTLNLQQNGLSMDEIQHIANALEHNTTLTILHLEHNSISGYGAISMINSLKNNRTLTTVNLAHNQIGPSEARYFQDMLQQNTTLTHFNIQNNQIGDQGVQFIANALKTNTTLKILTLEQNGISTQGAKSLAEGLKNNIGLITLNVQSNTIGDMGMQYLSDALPNNITLNLLNLAYNRIGILGIQYLKDALPKNKSLTTLDLGGNSIDSSGAEYLSDAIRNNTTLKTLILGFNQIGPLGTKYLSDALETNTVLTTIDLRANGIGPLGAKHLANALKKNTTLTTLYFRGNNIGLTGSEYFADMLQHNKTLITLFLENNQIGDDGLEYLANALQDNTTLKTLNLAQNNIRISQSKYIAELLENNRTLIRLILTKNEIPTRGAEYIAVALQNNMTITTIDIQENNSINENIFNVIEKILLRNRKLQDEYMDYS